MKRVRVPRMWRRLRSSIFQLFFLGDLDIQLSLLLRSPPSAVHRIDASAKEITGLEISWFKVDQVGSSWKPSWCWYKIIYGRLFETWWDVDPLSAKVGVLVFRCYIYNYQNPRIAKNNYILMSAKNWGPGFEASGPFRKKVLFRPVLNMFAAE